MCGILDLLDGPIKNKRLERTSQQLIRIGEEILIQPRPERSIYPNNEETRVIYVTGKKSCRKTELPNNMNEYDNDL